MLALVSLFNFDYFLIRNKTWHFFFCIFRHIHFSLVSLTFRVNIEYYFHPFKYNIFVTTRLINLWPLTHLFTFKLVFVYIYFHCCQTRSEIRIIFLEKIIRIQTMAENTSYAEWIKTVQEDRNAKANWRCNVSDQDRPLANAPRPPPFPHVTLFKSDLVETYAAQMTSKPTSNFLWQIFWILY